MPTVRVAEASGSEREGVITAEFLGFMHRGGARHQRRLSWSQSELAIEDRIEGQGTHVLESALPLAAAVDVEGGSPCRAGGMTIESIGPVVGIIEERWLSERFFQRVRAPAVVARAETALPTTLGWRVRLPFSTSAVR
jgi:hypothetical protein